MNQIRRDAVWVLWYAQLEAAQKRPWLASLLLRRSAKQYCRFTFFCNKLRALPRRTRRLLQARLSVTLAGAALLLAFSRAPSVHAATITVDGTTCSLDDAIRSANLDTVYGGCTAGSGDDTLDLQLDAVLSGSPPPIYSRITLEGNGHTIDGNGSYQVLNVASGGELTLNNVSIMGGSSAAAGGGIYNAGTVTVNNSTISGNSAGTMGGGIHNVGGSVTLNQSTISGNVATGRGGGIYNGNTYVTGRLTVHDSTISSNIASGDGGGIFNADGTMTVNNSTISGNSGTFGGGITNFGFNQSASATIYNSTMSGNSASGRGGGILNYGAFYATGTITVTNSTVTGNSASAAGGFLNQAVFGTATINLGSSIVSGNSGAGVGDEFGYFAVMGTATVNANNYNLLGESSKNNAAAFTGFTPCSGGGCTDITATSDGSNPTPLNGILDAVLSNNGGSTLTHALVSGSPAVDQVPIANAICTAGISVDQRGGVRADGAGRGGIACDSGAYEFDSAETPTFIRLRDLSATSRSTNGIAAVCSALSLAAGVLWMKLRRREREEEI